MTRRARKYMAIAAIRHLAVGVLCIALPGTFQSGSYAGIVGFLRPLTYANALPWWGWLFILVCFGCALPIVTARPSHARLGLVASSIVTWAWVGGFLAAIPLGAPGGYTGIIAWSALAAKDLVLLEDPLRSPFEWIPSRGATDSARR